MTPAHRHDGSTSLTLLRGLPLRKGFSTPTPHKAIGSLWTPLAMPRPCFRRLWIKGFCSITAGVGSPGGERRRANLRRLRSSVYRLRYRRRWELETVLGWLKGSLG